ncbi:MAG: glycosyltransferase family 4 protein [Candidatus Paceibacterota bacterium]
MKPKILYYSDCYFFGGCENMIVNFLSDSTINKEFRVYFGYNYSEIYEQGLKQRVQTADKYIHPLNLIKQVRYVKSDGSKLASIINKVFYSVYIPLNKYFSIIVNTLLLAIKIRKIDPDILHINNGGYPAAYSCYSAVFAAKLTGIKHVVYVVNNLAEDYKHPFRWFDYILDTIIIKSVDKFVTGSDYAKTRLLNVLNIEKEKAHTINNGVRKRNVTISRDDFKSKYSIPFDRKVFSVVANLEKRKGHIFLLKAMVQIKENDYKNRCPFLVIEGSGPEKKVLQKFITDNNLTSDVLMIDYVSEIFNLYNASDVIVLPSINNEDFPNVVIEAMSLGKPVIGTHIAGIPEQIVDYETGLIVEPASVEDLCKAIVKLNNNPELISSMSKSAEHLYNQKYRVSCSTKKYFNIYRSLMSNKK